MQLNADDIINALQEQLRELSIKLAIAKAENIALKRELEEATKTKEEIQNKQGREFLRTGSIEDLKGQNCKEKKS